MTDLNLLLKHTSRSLYLSARCLPRAVRASFSIAYLLCRYADSIADTALLAPERRIYWIRQFAVMITHPDTQQQQQLVREISGSSSNIYEEKLLRNLPACLQAFAQLSAPQQHTILEVVKAVCQGMEIDLTTFPAENSHELAAFQTEEELQTYCHLMGGEPGVFWSKLICSHVSVNTAEENFLSFGRDVGDSLQIVNILRDLPRDLRIGRCYFPAAQLEQYGLHAEDLLEQINSPRFEPIKAYWINWARQKLTSSISYFAAIPKTQLRHRTAVAWPMLWAADTLNKLEKESNLLDSAHKVKIPRSRIYFTMCLTPFVLVSNTLFNTWLCHKLHISR